MTETSEVTPEATTEAAAEVTTEAAPEAESAATPAEAPAAKPVEAFVFDTPIQTVGRRKEAVVRVRGPGSGRESAIRALINSGISVKAIVDVIENPKPEAYTSPFIADVVGRYLREPEVVEAEIASRLR